MPTCSPACGSRTASRSATTTPPRRTRRSPPDASPSHPQHLTIALWVVLGLLVPFGLGIALTGSVIGGLTGMLWGGAVRILFLHHATFSINSLCHFFGRRRFQTGDESRNLAWLAIPTFGEAWHNNHHAFPSSAHHGLTRAQLDPGGWLIDGLERLGLAWDVIRITPTRQQAKLAADYRWLRPEPPSIRRVDHQHVRHEEGPGIAQRRHR
ncbi:MAG: fatty acid desaturase [Solirubrobacteraceae bacterium]